MADYKALQEMHGIVHDICYSTEVKLGDGKRYSFFTLPETHPESVHAKKVYKWECFITLLAWAKYVLSPTVMNQGIMRSNRYPATAFDRASVRQEAPRKSTKEMIRLIQDGVTPSEDELYVYARDVSSEEILQEIEAMKQSDGIQPIQNSLYYYTIDQQ